MQLIELLLFDGGGGAHHDVLGVLVHGEGDDLADGALAREEHDHAVDARGDARVRRRAVAEGVVHGGELLLHVLLAQTHQLEGLDHDLGVVVPDGAGGQLHAVADEVILVGVDVQRIHLAALGLEQRLHAAVGHRERVVAELQLAGLVADLVHREVDDPAELIALLVHVPLAGRAERLDHHADGLGRVLARGDDDERVRLQVERLGKLLLHAGDELRDAAGQLALFVDLEPVALGAGLHLAVGQELLNLLAGELAVGDVDHLHGLAA